MLGSLLGGHGNWGGGVNEIIVIAGLFVPVSYLTLEQDC